MLESIQIKNFAIIDSLELEFDQGMTALTGETGAGKSILLDAIKLISGDRADSDNVKSGRDRAEINVCFNIQNHAEAQVWLEQNEMASDQECIIRRIVFANGRSKAFINGHNAPLSQLKDLAQMLVDLHGQHEHQSLQKPFVQQQLLDTYLNQALLIESVKDKFGRWQKLQKQLKQVMDGSMDREQRIDLLNLYCQELNELNLAEGEIETLQADYNRLAHAGQLLETTSSMLGILYDNDDSSVQSLLSHCEQLLNSQLAFDSKLTTSHELIASAVIQVQEATNELRGYQQSIDIDSGQLDWLNQRISNAQDLARKHHVGVEKLPGLALELNQELETLTANENNLDDINQALEQSKIEYLDCATQLSKKREKTALSLSTQISDIMQQLGMDGGKFSIQVERRDSDTAFKATGIDAINYQVSANPGQPLKPLTKVASGGELSRISLAIQVIFSESSKIPTLIFDEVDSGVGGGIAEIVGKKLRWLGESRQVFCVTHLPQVASQAHQHYRVEKTKTADETTTNVVPLESEARLEEVARMLGGVVISDQTRAHASEMIAGRQA
ncbi:MAG: DNA repair protein RecN (Recombination protein N) [Gammaproteobacteria bacterium]|jgi:DNA repair protein RecN (Recombination protein N)